MLNPNNKLMLALMLSSSFIAQELKSNPEEELEEEVAGEEDSDEEKGLSKVAMIATGCATVAAVGIIVAACNKDKIKGIYDRQFNYPFKEYTKLEKQHHDENDSAKKEALNVKMSAELESVFHDAREKAELNLLKSTAKSTHPDFRTMLAQLAIDQTSAEKAVESAEKSFNEAVRAAEAPAVPAAPAAAEAAEAAAAAPSFPNLVSRVPVLKAALALDLVRLRIRLVDKLMYAEINKEHFIKHGKYGNYAEAIADHARRKEEAVREVARKKTSEDQELARKNVGREEKEACDALFRQAEAARAEAARAEAIADHARRKEEAVREVARKKTSEDQELARKNVGREEKEACDALFRQAEAARAEAARAEAAAAEAADRAAAEAAAVAAEAAAVAAEAVRAARPVGADAPARVLPPEGLMEELRQVLASRAARQEAARHAEEAEAAYQEEVRCHVRRCEMSVGRSFNFICMSFEEVSKACSVYDSMHDNVKKAFLRESNCPGIIKREGFVYFCRPEREVIEVSREV